MLPTVLICAMTICALDIYRLHRANQLSIACAAPDAPAKNTRGVMQRRIAMYVLAIGAIYMFGGWLNYI